jgi:hypothetical protein
MVVHLSSNGTVCRKSDDGVLIENTDVMGCGIGLYCVIAKAIKTAIACPDCAIRIKEFAGVPKHVS